MLEMAETTVRTRYKTYSWLLCECVHLIFDEFSFIPNQNQRELHVAFVFENVIIFGFVSVSLLKVFLSPLSRPRSLEIVPLALPFSTVSPFF